MKQRTDHISKLIKGKVKSIDPTAEIILFGSRARGDENPESDWDILILTNYSAGLQTERKFRNELYEIELETGEPLSVFVFSKKEWEDVQSVTPFYENVIREGILI